MRLIPFDVIQPTEESFLGEETFFADRTYELDLNHGRMKGKVEGLNALKQSVYKILATEKGVFPIYGQDYGLCLDGLFGMDFPIVQSELERRIMQALTWDQRVEAVDSFSFEKKGNRLIVGFRVLSREGMAFDGEWSVENL